MQFTPTTLAGAFVIDLQRRTDDRGYFARSWCIREFQQHGLNANVVQINTAHSPKAGTLRGLHWQDAPHAEVKIVSCHRGAIYDVIVDLRPQSPTCGQWEAFELTADNVRMLYVPEGFAHGYQTLVDDVQVSYQTTNFYAPECCRGLRFDDPAIGIGWPLEISIISLQDRTWPDFAVLAAAGGQA
jgi:dTDP-4-dehydrorhamnose 3,5-epimerase